MTELEKSIAISAMQFKWSEQDTWSLSINELLINKGEKVFLYGPSGSGKTTFLDLITGIHIPQKGSIKILGESLQAKTAKQRDQFRADHIGLIFQQFNLLPYLNIIENVILPCHFSEMRKRNALQKSSLEQQAKDLLSGLGIKQELFSRKATSLSVGQQQRVAVARALIGSPEIIIADEPTSALDEDTRNDFVQELFEQSKENNTTTVFVSHDKTLEQYFDRSISIESLINQEEKESVL